MHKEIYFKVYVRIAKECYVCFIAARFDVTFL